MPEHNYTCDLPGCDHTFCIDGTGWTFTDSNYLDPERQPKVRFCSQGHLEDYQQQRREHLKRQKASEDARLQAAAE